MKPTVGRIVLYALPNESPRAGEVRPAIVTDARRLAGRPRLRASRPRSSPTPGAARAAADARARAEIARQADAAAWLDELLSRVRRGPIMPLFGWPAWIPSGRSRFA